MDVQVERQQAVVNTAQAADAVQRWQISIGRGLMLAFGGLVFLAVAIVLALGFWSARENTISLTRQLAETTLYDMERALADHLDPARAAIEHLATGIEGGRLDPADESVMVNVMSGALAPTPQIAALLYVRPDGTAIRTLRTGLGAGVDILDIAQEPEAAAAIAEARRMGVEIIRTEDGENWPTVSRQSTGYGETPWTIGVYFRNEDVGNELRRLVIAGSAGLVVLALAVLSAWLLSRYLAPPLNGLAIAAALVRDFELQQFHSLPNSRLREIDAAANAFNAMVGSLRWFEVYVPRTLVQRLIRQGGGELQQSEQRIVTVLFTDVAGFTALSESMSAEATAALLNEHFAVLGECVEAEDGTIDKFIGDALMAFWGAPDLQPDHAERACRAALAMRAAIDTENSRRTAAGLPIIGLRIGVHTGEAIVGNIGAPGRINYTIVGDTVNIANRLESLAKQYPATDSAVDILLSAETRAAAPEATAAARSIGDQQLTGRREPIEAFAL